MTLFLPAELLATDRFWERERFGVSSCISTKPMVTQTDLAKLIGSQNKAKRDEGEKRHCMEVRGSIG